MRRDPRTPGFSGSQLATRSTTTAYYSFTTTVSIDGCPPGGHLEPGETLAGAAGREFRQETGLEARVVSAAPEIHPADGNATAEPVPFYADVEVEGFRKPALAHFYFVELTHPESFRTSAFEVRELHGMRLFNREELATVPTFEQVRSLGAYALEHHPNPTSHEL